MSRLDIAKSLLRSVAEGAGSQLSRLRSGPLREWISRLTLRRMLLPDSQLTAAVARVPDVAAATVSTRDGQLRVDVGFRDGSSLLVHLTPLSAAFAPRGAKEWSLRAEPESAAQDVRCADIVVAIAGEVAHALWGPFLRGRGVKGRGAFAHREGSVLVVDFRNLPEVRSALGQPLLAAAIEAFGLRGVEASEGGLRLLPNVAMV
jgi:hypothetical protein